MSDEILLIVEKMKKVEQFVDSIRKDERKKTLKQLKQKINKLKTIADAECLEDLKEWKDSDLIRKSEVLKILEGEE